MSYPSSYPGGPDYSGNAPQQSTYPGGPSQSSYPTSSYPGQQTSTYPGQNNQSSYDPYGQRSQQPTGGYQPPNQGYHNNNQQQGGYQPPNQGQGQGQPAPVQYDANGQPIQDGERGIGTMALGAMGGWAANKASGGHHGFASAIGGAIVAQAGKKIFEKFNDKKH